ncbi:signal transduction histidine kinase [Bacillus mesophilus]|uniref:histidine kinase n=1 Tax=Bacillus mesophilus TaxID=1808955 RepID=A0A6M0Q6Y5_9BACI|nr:ATP-binding protein [Bacillus mesophilus]MBM7661370.1 signal transduction histidine kinase [Bacillus mesophilus]NEY72043.1 PAS domain-containing protein [Bacillus mesophilus]
MSKSYKLILFFIVSVLWFFGIDLVISLGDLSDSFVWYVERAKEIVYILFVGIFLLYAMTEKEELREIKEAKQHLSTLINAMVDCVNFKDGQGRWIEANDFGLKLFQLEGVDYKGKKDSEIAEYASFYREALIYCETSDEEAWLNGTTTRCEEIIPMPDGSEKIFDSIKIPLFYENGARKGLVAIGRDVTDQKLNEEILRRAEKLSVVGELAASVGHEIRNPLTSLKGFVQLFLEDEENQKHKPYYEIMLSELDRINHIVGELLILAKPQKISISKHSINLIMTDVISLVETQANMNNVKIKFEAPDDIVIDCSENQLKQLFINLIKNAIEASNSNSEVVVSILRSGVDLTKVLVEDRGIGLSEEFLSRIGEPFYSSKEKGTGLGLTVSMKIVEQHKGKLQFHSEKNVGTKVEVTLPISHIG